MSDDFYIGYESKMPAGLRPRVRAAAATALTLAVVLPALLIGAQKWFSDARFEFGQLRTLEGRIVEYPYPVLEVAGPTAGTRDFYWIVGPGKHGASALVRGLDGRVARVRGTLIERDGDAMLQIEPGGIDARPGESTVPSPLPVPLRTVQLVGEIVDSKCHLGVMKPGEGPTHRDCAVRCLLGQVPPMVLVHGPSTASGLPRRLALLDEHGRPFAQDMSAVVGRPLAIRGTLLRQRDRQFLAVRASDIEAMR